MARTPYSSGGPRWWRDTRAGTAPPESYGAWTSRARGSCRSCYGPPQEKEPRHEHHGTRQAERHPTSVPTVNEPDGDSDPVQATGGHDETHAVQQPALAFRELGAVGVAVEDRKEGNDEQRNDLLGSRLGKHHGPQHDGRHRNPHLDPRQRRTHQAEHATTGHHHGKGHRQQPDGGSPELSTP